MVSVKDFYDDFLEKKMINYRIDGNKRINAAIDLIVPLVPVDGVVADIGCGIGIIAEAIAKQRPGARVYAVDISPANVAYANRTVDEPNLEIFCSSVVEHIDDLRSRSSRPFDLLALVDVIEHIPAQDRPKLLSDLAGLGSDNATLVLTYPSPEYQRYLTVYNPDELQILDNVIELQVLLDEAAAAGWHIAAFRYVDVWMTNQYIHALFKRHRNLVVRPAHHRGFLDRVRQRWDRTFIRPRRIRKYALASFEDKARAPIENKSNT